MRRDKCGKYRVYMDNLGRNIAGQFWINWNLKVVRFTKAAYMV